MLHQGHSTSDVNARVIRNIIVYRINGF